MNRSLPTSKITPLSKLRPRSVSCLGNYPWCVTVLSLLSRSCCSTIPLRCPPKDTCRVLPERLPFKPHNWTVPFRLTSNRSIESDPAIGINDHPNIVAPARFRYSTSGFTATILFSGRNPCTSHHGDDTAM